MRAPTEKIKKTLIGLTLLEMSDEGYIFAVIEYVPDPVNMTKVNTIQTFVLVTENAEAYEFDSGCDSLTLVHYHGANAYFLTRGDGSITILSLDAEGAEQKKTQNYKVMIELAE